MSIGYILVRVKCYLVVFLNLFSPAWSADDCTGATGISTTGGAVICTQCNHVHGFNI